MKKNFINFNDNNDDMSSVYVSLAVSAISFIASVAVLVKLIFLR